MAKKAVEATLPGVDMTPAAANVPQMVHDAPRVERVLGHYAVRGAGVPVIAVEPDRRCTACGKVDECRPYGKGGAQVCFDCAMATPESKAEAERQMGGVVPLYGWLPFATLRDVSHAQTGVGLRIVSGACRACGHEQHVVVAADAPARCILCDNALDESGEDCLPRGPGCLDPRCERCWVDVDGEDDE